MVQNQILETIQSPFRSEEPRRQLPETNQSGLRSEDEANAFTQQVISVPRLVFLDDPENYPATPDHQYENPNLRVSMVSTDSEYSKVTRFQNEDAVQDDTSHA